MDKKNEEVAQVLYLIADRLAWIVHELNSKDKKIRTAARKKLKAIQEDLSAMAQAIIRTLYPYPGKPVDLISARFFMTEATLWMKKGKKKILVLPAPDVKVPMVASSSVQTALTRCLNWFVERLVNTNAAYKQPIVIKSFVMESSLIIEISDKSPRLSKELRQTLFHPSSQAIPTFIDTKGQHFPGILFPLYVARILIECQGGTLEDATNEKEEVGHTFRMMLPGVQSSE